MGAGERTAVKLKERAAVGKLVKNTEREVRKKTADNRKMGIGSNKREIQRYVDLRKLLVKRKL